MYIWANSEYIRFCSTATAVENHMKAEFSESGSFRRRYIRRNSLTFLTGPFLDPLMKKGVSRRVRPGWYIQWSIRGTFRYIRVNSENIRFCSTAAAVEKHMKTEGFWEWQFQTSVHSPQQPHLFIIIKREGTVREQAKTTHGHGCSGDDYRILPPRVGGS